MCWGRCVCVGSRGQRGERSPVYKLWRPKSRAEQLRNSVPVSAPLMRGQGAEISLQSSLFVAL